MGEIRLVGLVLAARGGCGPGEIRLGPIRWGWRGEGTVWARLPFASAAKVAAEGRVALGWAGGDARGSPSSMPQALEAYVRAACSASIDRSGLCYRCGRAGHIARVCALSVACAVCREGRRDSGHRVGGPECPLVGGGSSADGRLPGHCRGRPPNAGGVPANPGSCLGILPAERATV
ncbi:uncharacterized protein LOC116847990 [Odontomachus brunneus]|uniref:uncharacterized protein LOC116847990 n=1 Tax=Odontomachus brunneus TaxID=486640 RepID=UPI0013F23BFE|nr:uncharacterized protein LOC116847990 [Odontomachus brunneus]